MQTHNTKEVKQALSNLKEWLNTNKDMKGSTYYINREAEAHNLKELIKLINTNN